ncbi:Inducible T-cell costimulator, partial [Camelus dromedarius]
EFNDSAKSEMFIFHNGGVQILCKYPDIVRQFKMQLLKGKNTLCELKSQLCCQLKFWLPIGCAAFVVVYIFGFVLTCWLTKKKYRSSVHDPNSEYMFMAAVNTAKKPRLTDVTRNIELSGTQA